MNESAAEIVFKAYKESTIYAEEAEIIDLEWLEDKLSEEEIDKLENQILSMLVRTEEKMFKKGFFMADESFYMFYK